MVLHVYHHVIIQLQCTFTCMYRCMCYKQQHKSHMMNNTQSCTCTCTCTLYTHARTHTYTYTYTCTTYLVFCGFPTNIAEKRATGHDSK